MYQVGSGSCSSLSKQAREGNLRNKPRTYVTRDKIQIKSSRRHGQRRGHLMPQAQTRRPGVLPLPVHIHMPEIHVHVPDVEFGRYRRHFVGEVWQLRLRLRVHRGRLGAAVDAVHAPPPSFPRDTRTGADDGRSWRPASYGKVGEGARVGREGVVRVGEHREGVDGVRGEGLRLVIGRGRGWRGSREGKRVRRGGGSGARRGRRGRGRECSGEGVVR